jgi:hypothetical protein
MKLLNGKALPCASNARAERRVQRVRSSLLFGGIPVPPPSW